MFNELNKTRSLSPYPPVAIIAFPSARVLPRRSPLPHASPTPKDPPGGGEREDPDDDLPSPTASMDELAHEFASVSSSPTDPAAFASKLDLLWNLRQDRPRTTTTNPSSSATPSTSSSSSDAVPCTCCQGSGHRPCGYCGETGFLQVGSYVIRSEETGAAVSCPVCLGSGDMRCKDCNGLGHLARWLRDMKMGQQKGRGDAGGCSV